MPRFVWKVKDRSGKEQIQQVEATTAASSKEQLIALGFQAIQLMQDDIGSAAADMQQEASNPKYRHQLPAEEVLKFQEIPPSFLGDLWRSFRQGLMWNLICLALSAWHFYERSPVWGAIFAAPVLVLPALNWWFGIPMLLFDELNRAKTRRFEPDQVLAELIREVVLDGATDVNLGTLVLK
ncbi:MAG: hypothetical protein ACPGVU_16605 [Limisphaerales bacterium]